MSLQGSQGRTRAPAIQVQVGENEPHNFYLDGQNKSGGAPASPQQRLAHVLDVGIFRDTLAPSLALHGSLAVAAWGVGRYSDRVEAKDWLWPAGIALNTWYSAVGRHLLSSPRPRSLTSIAASTSWPERLILTGVTAWSARTLYRLATRSLRRGKDDPRYETADRKDSDFWLRQLLTRFLPEALLQAVVALPVTAPFRHQGAVMTGYHPYGQMAAVGLFSAGFALEVVADAQLAAHEEKEKENRNEGGLCREGVWSIVRHPNYLGDVLIHASFPLLLYSSDMLAPVELLGPLANYIFLRYFTQTEASQEASYEKDDPAKKAQLDEYKGTKNSFWPGVGELQNSWTWIVVGAGAVGVVVEQGLRRFH